jgi:hypothetical protein
MTDCAANPSDDSSQLVWEEGGRAASEIIALGQIKICYMTFG